MIDSHCHLDSRQYGGRHAQLLESAQRAGVSTVVNIGADLPSSETSVALASEHAMVYATVGIHPHDATTLDERAQERLRELASNKKVVAIGEIGLDYYRDLSPRTVQKKAFKKQLQLAAELKMPVVIHTREAFLDTLDIVKDFGSSIPGGVFHCFPGNVEDALRVIDQGFIISVGGVITYKGSQMSITATQVPLEFIIVETDAPYLTPVPHRGQLNEPAYVRLVYDKLAQLKAVPFAEVEQVVDRNCRKLYRMIETFGG
ncbi:hydrolase TatD [candidate division GN15 bacterium]|uniref:Hydrolase TatD n=1 Tax=candidate division GN15 bacterium TaxID=2072418 RepID=A0A855XBQ6_9BACT|nr:MAG: hydrolase TatD [candidate division GN15 bacterium]